MQLHDVLWADASNLGVCVYIFYVAGYRSLRPLAAASRTYKGAPEILPPQMRGLLYKYPLLRTILHSWKRQLLVDKEVQWEPTLLDEKKKRSQLRDWRKFLDYGRPADFAELPESEVFRDVQGWTPGYRARKRFGFSKPQGGFSVFGQKMGRGHGGSNCPQ